MIICPNLSNPDVAREFEELKQATSKKAAYYIWSLNNGNHIDRAPNGAPSILFLSLLEYYGGDRVKAIQAKAKTYSKSFLEWFGDWIGIDAVYDDNGDRVDEVSKVVDKNGEPLITYHGTPNSWETFDVNKIGSVTDDGYYGRGLYLSSLKKKADEYNKGQNGRTLLLYAKIVNPFYAGADKHLTLDESTRRGEIVDKFNRDDLPEELKQYDGVLYSGGDAVYEEIVIKEPNLIKSVDNRSAIHYEGTFSKQNNNIYYQLKTQTDSEEVQQELDQQVNLAVQELLKQDPNTTSELLIELRLNTTRSWAERRQAEIIGQTQLRLAEAFGLKRNEDGTWSTDSNDEISLLRLEFVKSLGDHAGHITIDKHSTKAHYAIAIGLLEGDATTFNHELAHYYIHTFWNSKLILTALKLVYDKKKHGDITTIEGRRAVEEALVDAITERSVDNMFDVKLAHKSLFLSFWETLNQLLYKVFNIKTKVALNAIVDQITASFLVNELLAQSERNVEIKEIQGLFNQNFILKFRRLKKITYKQRKVGTMEVAYNTASKLSPDEQIVRNIVETTQRKARLYSTRSIGANESSIYGVADLMALNQEAVRKVKILAQNISESIQAKDAQRELHEKALMFMDFMQRSLEEVTRLNRILDNAEANDYRKTAYIVDDAGEKQYRNDSGQIKAENPTAKIQEFNYDELEYIRDNVLGFIEPVVTAIESLLSEAQQLGYSDQDVLELQEFLYNTLLVAQIKHVLAKYNSATKRKINSWIDKTVDARKELNDDFKRRLKVNMKNWASDQMIFGDVSLVEIGIGMGSHSKSPIVRAMQDIINDMTDERNELVYQKGLALMELEREARKAVSWKYKLFGMNFQKLLMLLDKRGLPTGNLLSEYNDGQYYQDLTEYRDKLAFGKNGLENKLKAILGDDFELRFDKSDIPIIPENDVAEALAKEFMTKIDEWKCDHGRRLFTKKYYQERNKFLSFKALRAVSQVNNKIEDLTRAITINGKLRLDLLTETQQDELAQYLLERLFLGNIYTPDGLLKEEGSEERQIAEEISRFRAQTRHEVVYTIDWAAYYESHDNAKNQQAFENRYLHYQINPRIFELLKRADYSKYQDVVELQNKITTLRSYRNSLINQYKGPSFGLIYWSKLIQNGELLHIDFWKALQDIDEQISEISAEIKSIIDDLKAANQFDSNTIKGLDYSELFEEVLIPADRTAQDAWTNPRVLTVLAKMKMQIRERINNDPSIPAAEKPKRILELLSLLEYYNAATDKVTFLSIFSVDKPLRESVTTDEGEVIPLFKQIPTGVFTKLDKNNSSREYVNLDFDDSDGRYDKPGEEYKDERWELLLKMPEAVRKLYDEIKKTMEESWNMIPFLGKYDGRMALIGARTGQRLGRQWYKRFGLLFLKNLWSWLKYEFSVAEDDLYYDEHEARNRRPDGAINKSIPLRFINRLELPEYITSDVVGSTILFYNMALNWRIKSKNLAFFTLLQQRIGMMNFSDTTGQTEYKQTNQSKVVSGIMDRQLYECRTIAGQTIKNITGRFTPNKYVKAIKNIGKVRAVAHLGLLAMNLSSAIISFLDPLMSLVIDTVTGKYINAKDDLYALGILFANINLVFTGGSIKANNKVKAAMLKFHLDESTARMFADTDMSQLSRFLSDGITMKLFSFGDYTINAMSMVGTMHNYKCYEYKDGHKEFLPKKLFISTAMQDSGLTVKDAKALYNNKKTKNMWLCCEVDKKTGEFRAKQDEYGKSITDETWRAIRKLTQSRSSIYTGVVGDTERTLLQTDALMSFLTMMRNFLITGIWDRFKSQRDFLVTTFDDEGRATFGDMYADELRITKYISSEEAKNTQRYYRGGFSFSTRLIEDGIYIAGLQFFKQMGPYLNLLIKSSIFRGSKAISKYDRELYMKENDLNSNTVYSAERLMLELGGWFILALLLPLSKKAADDDKDNYYKQMLYLLNLRLSVERITYYNPSTLMETITTPATAYSDFKRKTKGLDLLFDFTPFGEHDPNDLVKQGNFKGEKRWKYDLFSMFSSFGLYNWYTNMPEIKVGEYNVGGGDAKTIRNKANFYKKFDSFILKALPYGQVEPTKLPKAPKTLFEKRQERLNKKLKARENRQKQLEKRRKR